MRQLLGGTGVLLCPAHPTPPPYHGQSYTKVSITHVLLSDRYPVAKYMSDNNPQPFNFLHTAVFSLLGLPATVVPVQLSQASSC